MTPEMKAKIDAMDQIEMARLWRFAPIGSPILSGDTGQYFSVRFKSLGGMTPEVSKYIGW